MFNEECLVGKKEFYIIKMHGSMIKKKRQDLICHKNCCKYTLYLKS